MMVGRSSMIDAVRVRDDFPILRQTVRGQRLVYLDSAASAQKPAPVLDAMRRYYEESHANVHRGVHVLAERATAAYEGARASVAAFLGAASPQEIVWTRGTTEALNLVAHSWARPRLRPGDEILVTMMEHHSNIVPWQMAAEATGAVLRYLPLREEYRLDLDRLDEFLTRRTRLFAVTHISNVLGTVNPIKELADAAHRVGALIVVDAAQSVPHRVIRVKELGCDFLAMSGHKLPGPTGIGVLYGKSELLESMSPFMGGGEMILEVGLDRSTYKPPPHRFEAGTPAIAETVGLAAAVEYLERLGMEEMRAHEEALTGYALRLLSRMDGVRIQGPPTDRGGVFSFSVEGIHPHDLATVLDSEGVAVRAGHHCAQPLLRWLRVPATARASLYVYNTPEDLDALGRAVEKAQEIFSRGVRPASSPS
jgi:cysteine desulfurase/selenocysteine lyase